MIELIAGVRGNPFIPTYRLRLLVRPGVVALLAGARPRLAVVAVLLLPQLHLLAERVTLLKSKSRFTPECFSF